MGIYKDKRAKIQYRQFVQCLKQRKNYLQNGKDIQYITDRFKFYKEALETKQINPQSEEISQEEKSL